MVVVTLGTTTEGDGAVTTYTPSGKELVELGAAMEGGSVQVFNKIIYLLCLKNGGFKGCVGRLYETFGYIFH